MFFTFSLLWPGLAGVGKKDSSPLSTLLFHFHSAVAVEGVHHKPEPEPEFQPRIPHVCFAAVDIAVVGTKPVTSSNQ